MNAIPDKLTPALPDEFTLALPPRRRPVGKRLLQAAIGAIAAMAVAVTASWWFREGRWIESTDNAYVQGDIAVLSPRIDGEIAAIPVADNQAVHAGDPLIIIDPADWQARLSEARASAAEADAAVITARRQVEQQKSAIDAAQAAVVQAAQQQRPAHHHSQRRLASRRTVECLLASSTRAILPSPALSCRQARAL